MQLSKEMVTMPHGTCPNMPIFIWTFDSCKINKEKYV